MKKVKVNAQITFTSETLLNVNVNGRVITKYAPFGFVSMFFIQGQSHYNLLRSANILLFVTKILFLFAILPTERRCILNQEKSTQTAWDKGQIEKEHILNCQYV